MEVFGKRLNNVVHSVLFFMVIKFSSLFKVSFVVGSLCAFFSLSNAIAPLSGAFFGISGTVALFLLNCFFSMNLSPFLFLVYHIPGFCASLYWSFPGIFVRLLVPLFCMVLFVVHPVGCQVMPYVLFWLIPVVIYCLGKKNSWLTALGSTFVAHAVGTVIWLYGAPTTPQFWYALVPVVVVERLLFASGMVIAYKVINAFWLVAPRVYVRGCAAVVAIVFSHRQVQGKELQ